MFFLPVGAMSCRKNPFLIDESSTAEPLTVEREPDHPWEPVTKITNLFEMTIPNLYYVLAASPRRSRLPQENC